MPSHKRVNSADSILSILSCSSKDFSEFFYGDYTTDLLVDCAKKIITQNEELFRQASKNRYRLGELVLGMLDHAPDSSGQRYVAIVLRIANRKGIEAVIDAATAWLDYLFFPMLALSNANKTEPRARQTPTFNDTLVQIEGAARSEQADLRAAIATREQYRCAVIQSFDLARVKYLTSQRRGHEVPRRVPQIPMEAAYIIPFSLNKFDETNDSSQTAVYTWDMLHSWTGIDIRDLVGSRINSPENGIYMNHADHCKFGSFLFYFDKDEYPDLPNKYRVRMARPDFVLANGEETADVEFQANTGVPPPSGQFLKIHAAFAKVLSRSDAAAYMERVEMTHNRGAPIGVNLESDFATLLSSKLREAQFNH